MGEYSPAQHHFICCGVEWICAFLLKQPCQTCLAQGENAPALQKMFINFKGWQIITEERVENLVSIVPGLLKLRLKGRIRPLSDTRTEVIRDDVAFEIPGRRFPLEISSDREEINYVEWLYLDDDLRITTGSRGSYFIHVREG